jgi:hypothetical protein
VLRVVETAGRDSRDVDHSVGDATMGVVSEGLGAVLEDDGRSVGGHDADYVGCVARA